MRSLLSLPTSLRRRGLGVLTAALVTLATGCSWITGVPDVESVDVSVTATSIPVGGTAQATAVLHGKNNKIVNSTRIVTGFESSNPSVATVSSQSGTITGVSEGVAVITARARGKSDTVSITVVPQIPSRVDIRPQTLFLGERIPLVIDPIGSNGQSLGKRQVTIGSSNTNIIAIDGDGTTTGTFIRGVTVGTATVSGNVGGTAFGQSITVLPPNVAKVQGALAKGTNTLLETETNQIIVSLFAADGTPIPIPGQSISFQSDDQTVAIVNSQTGVVTGVRAGTANITIIVGGTVARGTVGITVLPIPAVEVRFQNRGQFLRIATNGSGVPSSRTAIAFDSIGRQINGRQITYRSTDPTIFQVTGVSGTVVGQKLGTAKLIASADNGKVADTLTLTVTPVPITVVTVQPTQSQLNVGQTQQFTATITDSLGATVTGRTINWFSTTPTVMSINQQTGVGTAVASGTAQAQAQVEIVPGFPGFAPTQGGAVLVLPTPVASIVVNPSPISVQVGRTSPFTLTLKDSAGNTIFTGRQVSATVADPTIASVQAPQGTGTGSVAGLKSGSTTVTFQALDQGGNPQGPAVVVTVNVQ